MGSGENELTKQSDESLMWQWRLMTVDAGARTALVSTAKTALFEDSGDGRRRCQQRLAKDRTDQWWVECGVKWSLSPMYNLNVTTHTEKRERERERERERDYSRLTERKRKWGHDAGKKEEEGDIIPNYLPTAAAMERARMIWWFRVGAPNREE